VLIPGPTTRWPPISTLVLMTPWTTQNPTCQAASRPSPGSVRAQIDPLSPLPRDVPPSSVPAWPSEGEPCAHRRRGSHGTRFGAWPLTVRSYGRFLAIRQSRSRGNGIPRRVRSHPPLRPNHAEIVGILHPLGLRRCSSTPIVGGIGPRSRCLPATAGFRGILPYYLLLQHGAARQRHNPAYFCLVSSPATQNFRPSLSRNPAATPNCGERRDLPRQSQLAALIPEVGNCPRPP
jgi:hypothetical protein